MNNYGDLYNSYCCFHPKEVIIGICALCLRERLLNLASKQGHPDPISEDSNRSFRVTGRRTILSFTKVFALGSFLHRLESRCPKPNDNDDDSDHGSIGSLDDSFISIKFDNSGNASSSESRKKAEITEDDDNDSALKEMKREKSVVEHMRPRGALRWQKRVGQLLQLAGWKRSSKADGAHAGIVGKVEGGRRGWMRSLTRK